MADNYSYPLDLTWSASEITTVIAFFNQVEAFYEGIAGKRDNKQDKAFLFAYRAFKTVVSSRSQEKQLFKAFEKVSGYFPYRALQAVKNQTGEKAALSSGHF